LLHAIDDGFLFGFVFVGRNVTAGSSIVANPITCSIERILFHIVFLRSKK